MSLSNRDVNRGAAAATAVATMRYRVTPKLAAMRSLASRHGHNFFKLEVIVAEVYANGSSYKESTIRTHITSSMCKDAPDNHSTVYRDLERLGRGQYRLARP